jgi:predicted hotdog family 3-hydroxylacyl-ACP dehydratase
MAQAYAAMKGYQDLLNGRPIGRGYLVGIRKFEMLGTFDATDRLFVKVKTAGSFNDFYVAEGKVLAGNTCIAIGNMKLWIPSDD